MSAPQRVTTIRDAHPDERLPVSLLLAEAFLHGDLGPWLIPNIDLRSRVYRGYFSLQAEHAFNHGQVEVIDVGGELPAVALWYTDNGTSPPEIENYDSRLPMIVGQFLHRFQALDQATHAYHPHDEAHHHLALLAVHPDHRNAGHGSALLRHHHSALDAAGMPAYLEATGTRHRALFARHGYLPRPAYQITQGGPTPRPTLYPMWRRPAPNNPDAAVTTEP